MHSEKINLEDIFMFRYKNLEKISDKKSGMKIIHSEKIYMEEIIVFWKKDPECNFIYTPFF